jgi:hypothetical protein
MACTAEAANDFPFGWSGKQAGDIVYQYDYDWDTHLAAYNTCVAANPSEPWKCKAESCNADDVPDEPTRAFRVQTVKGWRVQLNFPQGHQNRRMIGPTLHEAIKENSPNQLAGERRYCGVQDIVFKGTHGPKFCPQEFDDNEWLASPYYVSDGIMPNDGNIYVLNHQEFHGATASSPTACGDIHPENTGGTPANKYCSTASDPNLYCWWGSITFARSTLDPTKCGTTTSSVAEDGGPGPPTPNLLGLCYWHGTVTDNPPPEAEHLVATVPYPYLRDWGNPNGRVGSGGRVGYGEHSNILRGEGALSGYYYVAAIVRGPATGQQKTGVCMIRTNDLSAPSSWMAWNGVGFSARPASAYSILDSPANHTCEPVLPTMQPFSLTYNTYLRKYMILGHGALTSGSPDWRVYYSLSDDLVNWSDPQYLMYAPIEEDQHCEVDKVAYPVLLDSTDPAANATGTQNRNFDHPGRSPDLYFRVNPRNSDCSNRQPGHLARMPIQFEHRQATFEGPWGPNPGSTLNAERGFTTAAGDVVRTAGADYDQDASNQYAQATSSGQTDAWAYGRIGVNNWNNGDDVWYGAALNIPFDFASRASAQIDVVTWKSATEQGGIRLKANEKYQLFRSTGTPILYGSEFDLPTRRWVWVEVHQRLGTSNALSEVFVDGRLVSSTASQNRGAADAITLMRYGIVNITAAGSPTSMGIDRASVMGGQLGSSIGTGPYEAPKTPTGLRGVPASPTTVTLSWNAPQVGEPSADGYRLYRQTSDGSWSPVAETGALSFTDTVPLNSCGNKYRVTAKRTTADPLVPPNPSGTSVSESIYSSTISVDAQGCSP